MHKRTFPIGAGIIALAGCATQKPVDQSPFEKSVNACSMLIDKKIERGSQEHFQFVTNFRTIAEDIVHTPAIYDDRYFEPGTDFEEKRAVFNSVYDHAATKQPWLIESKAIPYRRLKECVPYEIETIALSPKDVHDKIAEVHPYRKGTLQTIGQFFGHFLK